MTNTASIFRVILEVSDLNKAAVFYSQLFNTEGRMVGGGRCYFDCGTIILAILDTGHPPKGIPQYIYFSVPDIEQFYLRAQTLKCLSNEIIHDDPAGEIIARPWGERSFYAEDPYGNGLCFVDKNTLFKGNLA